MVSKLREEPGFATLSVIDLYEHPTIAGLAAKADGTARGIRSDGACASPAAGAPGERGRHLRAGCVQGASLYLVFAVRALEWIAPYLTLFALLEGGRPLPIAAAWAAAAAVLSFPVLLAAAIAVKWTVLGRARAGRYPLWGAYYLRFWLVRNTIAGLHLSRLSGTPLLPWALRLLGARVGSDVHLDSDEIAAFDLVEIGDGACVDEGASLVGAEVESGVLILGTVRVGRGCFVGARSVLRPGTVMEDGARLDDLSLLPAGGRVPRGETWAGSPAGRSAPPSPRVAPPRRARWHLPLATLLYAALVLVIPTLPLLAFAPGIVFLARFDPLERPLPYLAAALPVGASFVLLLTSGVVLAKWCLVGRVRPGRYAVHGSLYVRKWIVDRLMDLSLDVAGSLHATLYLAPWYRALGARLGRNVELSTATSSTPDLLEIEDGGTVADEVSLGAPHVEGGWMTLAPTVLRRRAFVGNGAIVRAGSVLGAESLVGVLSISPGDLPEALRPGAAWLGSPARRLPRRQESAPFPEGRTFSPGRRLRLARGGAEIFRVTLPPSGFIFVTTATVEATLAAWHRLGAPGAILLAPLFFATCGLLLALGVAVAKWALLGRLRPFEHPLWSPFVWRLELVTALYEFMLTPILLEALHGTPMLPWYFRLLGARIGRRTYFHTTGLIEFDLVEVGDRAAIGDEAVLQTHLFEDRVLKGSSLRIGAGCCVGAGSVVLYDAEMAEGSTLGPLSLLMKGETLPAGTAWAGLPPRSLAGPREPGPVLARESTEEPFTAPRAPGGRRTGPASPSHGSRAFS